MKPIYILGVRVHDVTMDEAVARVTEFMVNGGAHIIVTPNPEICLAAQGDTEFLKILNRADLAVPDGFGLLLAARILDVPLRERVTGVDLMSQIAESAAIRNWRIYLLGGDPGVAERAARTLQTRFPKITIVGTGAGGEEKEVVGQIRQAAPDIIFVAFGQVKQEKWIEAHLAELPSVKVAMGVGGAFDFLAGNARRAPRFFRVLGFEWLWRLMMEPRRVRRIWRAVVVFPYAVIRERLNTGKKD